MIVLERTIELFAKLVDVELQDVHADTIIRDAEEFDSLDLAEFIMSIEEEFGVEIPDLAVSELKTIAEVARFVDQKLKSGPVRPDPKPSTW